MDEKQLDAARAAAWGQAGEPLVTLEAARAWVNERGLVLFAPRSAQLPVAAPSLVEATLGAANAAAGRSEMQTARGLVARLAAEGSALPLNLLGLPGEEPDFVVSAQVFSYVFTMRGDKAWKQAPATTGAVKVSPLGLRVWETLGESALSAAELANELGREVTEAAIVRALSELWSQLRVIPLLQAGDGVTLWERTTRRFTKAIKAGANAGQPTALSALASLYLRQVFAATEDDVATFLSPLTARSRVREVLHALVGARQLETLAVAGKTLLHVPGTLPQAAVSVAAEAETEDGVSTEAPAPRPKKVGTGRITSFTKTRTEAGEFRGKPVRTFAKGGPRAMGGARPTPRFGARADGKSDRERRPFKKDGPTRPAGKPSFAKPWEEDRKPRPAAAKSADTFAKYKRPAKEDREPLGPREQAGLPAEKRTYPKKSFEKKFDAAKSFGPKKSFDRNARPGGFAKRAPGGFAKRPYTPRTDAEATPGSFKPRSYERKPSAGSFGERKPKPGGFAERKPFAGSFAKRSPAPGGFKDRAPRPGGFGKRPYQPREAANDGPAASSSADSGRTIPKRPFKPRAADAHERPFTKAPWKPESEDKRNFKPRSGAGPGKSFGAKPKFGGKPGGKFDGKPGSKFGGKPAGKFGGKPGGFAKRAPGGKPAPFQRRKPGAEE